MIMKRLIKFQFTILLIVISVLLSCKKEEVPVLTTSAVTSITATTAISGGSITSEGSSTVISRGVCWSTGTTPTIADNKTTDGAGASSFTSNITVLNGATVYFTRAYATNSVGTGYGMAISFTTLGQLPTTADAAATNVNVTSATLNGTVNSNYLSTVVTFEYGTTTSYGSTVTPSQSPITGNTATTVTSDITGLIAATIYHFRVKSVNSLGTTYSNDLTFTTLGLVPTVATTAATSVISTGATLNGTINANYLSTVVTFEYGTTTSYGNTVTPSQSPVTGSAITNVSSVISGLIGGTIYHFRVKAINSLGTTYGSDLTFTTLGQVPTVTTLQSTNVSTTSASVSGLVNANYLSSAVTFEYGTTTNYGNSISATQSPVTGNIVSNVSVNITGLTPGAIYHFRVKAINSLGTSYGVDLTFKTLGQVPTAVTMSASNITITGANLNGSVNANYLSTVVTFDYGTSTSYGSSATATQSPITGNTVTNVSASITGLIEGTTYHFRVKAENILGTTYGSDITFIPLLSNTVGDIDGNVYNIITIGTQVWMKENLKTTKYNDGTTIPNITVDATWAALTTGAYCDYSNNPANSTTYGRLYNWYSVDNNSASKVASNGDKNVCPTGWHVPSDTEWTTLTTFLGGEDVSGGKLKENGTTYWASPNSGATNETNFTAIPGGYRYRTGWFDGMGFGGNWWSSTKASASNSWYRDMQHTSTSVGRYEVENYGFSVRCLKD
jgi:uncharacterized protein (TIGR02145 family)